MYIDIGFNALARVTITPLLDRNSSKKSDARCISKPNVTSQISATLLRIVTPSCDSGSLINCPDHTKKNFLSPCLRSLLLYLTCRRPLNHEEPPHLHISLISLALLRYAFTATGVFYRAPRLWLHKPPPLAGCSTRDGLYLC